MSQSPTDIEYGPQAPPYLPDQDHPDGYGDPHPPGGANGTFSAEARDLIASAGAWQEVSDTLRHVWELTQTGWGMPGLFGLQDTLYVNGRLHRDLNRDLVNAAADGSSITAGLAAGLIETANDVDGTDRTEGANFRVLQNRAGQ